MSAKANHPIRILLVDDDLQSLNELAQLLKGAGHEVFTASDGLQAKRMLVQHSPQVVITDWHMPGMSGIELCRAIRACDSAGFVFLIVQTSRYDSHGLIQAFDAGADDFIVKPIILDELTARLRAAMRTIQLETDLDLRNREISLVNARMAIAARELQIANHRLSILATTDELTGALNRREALNRLNKLWTLSERQDCALAAIMLDIDHFKKFNDCHGHAAGDAVLREMIATLREVGRASDKICRMGGEEFLIICPNTAQEAAVAAERFRAAVAARPIRFLGKSLQVTISLGVAQRTTSMCDPDDLLRAADQALYRAKALGRDRVCVAHPETAQVSQTRETAPTPTTPADGITRL